MLPVALTSGPAPCTAVVISVMGSLGFFAVAVSAGLSAGESFAGAGGAGGSNRTSAPVPQSDVHKLLNA